MMRAGQSAAPRPRYSSRSLFTYEYDNFNISTGLTAVNNFTTNGDSDFFWEKFAALCLATDSSGILQATSRSADLVAPLTMNLINTTTGRSLGNVPIILANIDGYLQFQPEPMVWPRKSNIQFTIFNEDIGPHGGSIAIIQLSFIGTKAFF
jgi:hypothetical protein